VAIGTTASGAFLVAGMRKNVGPMLLTCDYGAASCTEAVLPLSSIASSCTSNATLAFMLTLFALLGWLLLPAAARLGEWARVITFRASLGPRVADFAKGVVDLGHVVFFLACITSVLACAIAVVRLRRWK
jgi:hypothetical protein